MGGKGGLEVDDVAVLEDFHSYMKGVDDDLWAIHRYVGREVCSTEGFTGAVSKLADVMPYIEQASWDLMSEVSERWLALAHSLWKAGRQYDLSDGDVGWYFDKTAEQRTAIARTKHMERLGL